MKLVIEMPEAEYKKVKEGRASVSMMREAIRNGTPLPKGHGRLIDADAMINKLCTQEASDFFGSVTCAEIMDFIENEKSIVEADKQEGKEWERKK